METIIDAKVLTGKRKLGLKFDKDKKLLIVEATEKPRDNKANQEIAKELKKFFKADTEIVSGLKSREKKIKISLSQDQVLEKLGNTN